MGDTTRSNVAPEPVPDEFTLTIDYYDTRGRHYIDSHELSVVTPQDHTRTTPGRTSPKRAAQK
ncbi:MAG: hypothetical protein ACLPLP_19670 [Mycobacterium sp.]